MRHALVNALLPAAPAHDPETPIPPNAFNSPAEVEQWQGYVGILRRDRSPNLRVWVQITKTAQTRPARVGGQRVPGWQTVEHDEVWRRVAYSFVGFAIPEGGTRAVRLGQLHELVEQCRPDDRRGMAGLTSVDRTALAHLWQRWHLNAENMRCPHQAEPTGDDEGVPQCTTSGYVYGSDRLIEPVDPKIRARIRQVGTALDRTRGRHIVWPDLETL